MRRPGPRRGPWSTAGRRRLGWFWTLGWIVGCSAIVDLPQGRQSGTDGAASRDAWAPDAQGPSGGDLGSEGRADEGAEDDEDGGSADAGRPTDASQPDAATDADQGSYARDAALTDDGGARLDAAPPPTPPALAADEVWRLEAPADEGRWWLLAPDGERVFLLSVNSLMRAVGCDGMAAFIRRMAPGRAAHRAWARMSTG